ncbi:MAG: DUF3473 domain-containing protein [Rhodobacteraceae bacterium]|nr:DUF3473 domain-containing protein [Paracoccaceae bacterium]
MADAMRILSVDLEDWFHILDNPETMTEENWRQFPSRVVMVTEKLLELLDAQSQKATFFILGYIARNHPELVQEVARRGHEIATHSDMHQLVYAQTPNAFEADLVASLEAITQACGTTPRAYRAPGFSITQEATWAFDIMARNGIEVDASLFPARRAHGGLPGFPEAGPCQIQTQSGQILRAFPMSVGKLGPANIVFSGGGYFRLTPRPLLNRLFQAQDYVMTYFHPRDFDPDQPMIPGLTLARRFKSYVGLRGAFAKLEGLLTRMDFITMGTAEDRVDWQTSPTVSVQ